MDLVNSSKTAVSLREVEEGDLPIFFEQQLDPEANHMAAFTVKDPTDQQGFSARWNRILNNETISVKTVLYHGAVAGSVLTFEQFGETEISYWIGKEYWGKGIATQALSRFLETIKLRPLYARAVKDNFASLRVLDKCGFKKIGEDKGFANARGEVVEEYILKLDD
jgi:RimJ/RimL family protein N-acetyltransferase